MPRVSNAVTYFDGQAPRRHSSVIFELVQSSEAPKADPSNYRFAFFVVMQLVECFSVYGIQSRRDVNTDCGTNHLLNNSFITLLYVCMVIWTCHQLLTQQTSLYSSLLVSVLKFARYYALIDSQGAVLPRCVLNWVERPVAAGSVEADGGKTVKKPTVRRDVKVKHKVSTSAAKAKPKGKKG